MLKNTRFDAPLQMRAICSVATPEKPFRHAGHPASSGVALEYAGGTLHFAQGVAALV